LDLGAGEALGLERAAEDPDVHDLARLDPDQGAAGELDAVVDAPDEEHQQSGHHQQGDDDEREAPLAEEVVVRVGEEAHGQMLRACRPGRRCSQMRKKVRVTKMAVTIEAMMPITIVTAKPLTGPVPNWKRKSAVRMVVTF